MKKLWITFLSLIISLSPLFALRVSPFTPVEGMVFLNENCTFSTIIPNIPPNQVQITVQSLPENVSFISSRKQEVFFEGEKSTSLFIVLNFSQKGTYVIPPIAARIQYGSMFISFTKVTVIDNPQNTYPRLYLEFENEQGNKVSALTAGVSIRAVLYGMYFSRLSSIKTGASENGILMEKQMLQTFPYSEATFTTKAIPLIEYEFIPLQEGEFTLNTITAEMITWGGSTISIRMENKTLSILPAAGKNQDSPVTNDFLTQEERLLFSSAFDPIEDTALEITGHDIDASKLFESALIKRKIIAGALVFSCLVCIICMILWFIFCITKRKKKSLAVYFFIFLFAVFCLILLLLPRYGLFVGGSVFTIPEFDSKTSFTIGEPAIVRIHLETGNWTYVSFPVLHTLPVQREGWVQSENIKKITLQERSN